MPHADDRELEYLVGELKDYLAGRPNAADTFEGVLRWWIKKQRLEASAIILKRALDILIKEGVLEEESTVGGETIYKQVPKEKSS